MEDLIYLLRSPPRPTCYWERSLGSSTYIPDMLSSTAITSNSFAWRRTTSWPGKLDSGHGSCQRGSCPFIYLETLPSLTHICQIPRNPRTGSSTPCAIRRTWVLHRLLIGSWDISTCRLSITCSPQCHSAVFPTFVPGLGPLPRSTIYPTLFTHSRRQYKKHLKTSIPFLINSNIRN